MSMIKKRITGSRVRPIEKFNLILDRGTDWK